MTGIRLPAIGAALLVCACSSDASSPVQPAIDAMADQATSEQPTTEADGGASQDVSLADGSAPPADVVPDAYPWANVSCATPPPAGAAQPAPPPSYSGGSCPTLQAGFNQLVSDGNARRFLLVLPSDPQPDETFPLFFMWYWLKGDPEEFEEKGEIQQAVDQQRFIAVIPDSKHDIEIPVLNADFPWPFITTPMTSDGRMEEEYTFFDDMLACVTEQYPVNAQCVTTVGVSAGALFSAHLAANRSQYLASLVSLSGGVGSEEGVTNHFIRRWVTPGRRLPVFVLWGGSGDSCALLNFEIASKALERALVADGHFFVECVHNCGHGEPPIQGTNGQSRYAVIWDFVLNHPFWLPAGQSPWLQSGLPASPINWCGIGAGSATSRVGVCDQPGCPI